MKGTYSSVWSFILNGVLVACAVVVTILMVRSEFAGARSRPPGQPLPPFFEAQEDWEEYFTGGHRIGATDASLALVIFSDYECPACRTLNEQLRQYQKDSTYRFTILYRHWPLARHRFAQQAAVASECAAAQGRFEQMHDSLFANQERLGVVPWRQLAASAGVADLPVFEQCMLYDTLPEGVQADVVAAKRLGARGTPAVIVFGGSRFAGVPSRQVLDSLLAAVSNRLPIAATKR